MVSDLGHNLRMLFAARLITASTSVYLITAENSPSSFAISICTSGSVAGRFSFAPIRSSTSNC